MYALLIPYGLLLGVIIAYLQTAATPEIIAKIVHVYPYVVFGLGLLLGWRFNRSQLIFALLVLAFADRGLLYFPAQSGPEAAAGQFVFHAACFLLPINFLVLSLLAERGIFTVRGIMRFCLIVLQVPAVALIFLYRPSSAHALFTYTFFDSSFVSWSNLAQPALLLIGLALVVLLIRFVYQRKAIESGFFWGLVTSCIALNTESGGQISTIYFATAGLILVISVVETSYVMAYRDELTGLPARRALKEYCLRLGSRYTVAMLDIDHFKKFNDRYGHDVGDQVLRMVASKIGSVSGGGKAFRYGGEEFTAIFSGKSVDEVIPHLERLRKTIETSKFTLRGRKRPRKKPAKQKSKSGIRKNLSVTISIGVAEREDRTHKSDQVIKAADKALYRAKKGGRNRVSI
jgi:diguanylate cyclase (GGDEF)-like protein